MISYIILLCLLVGMIVVSIRYCHRKLRSIGALICFLIILTCQFIDGPTMRGVVSQRSAIGKWSEDFNAGVFATVKALRLYKPFVVVSALGLLVFALQGRSRLDSKREEKISKVGE